jgi:hypothetical protein
MLSILFNTGEPWLEVDRVRTARTADARALKLALIQVGS